MSRRVFNGLTILSLLLSLATVALWVRSYWRNDTCGHVSVLPDGVQMRGIVSNTGELDFAAMRFGQNDRVGSHMAQGPAWSFESNASSAGDSLSSRAKLDPRTRTFSFLGLGFGAHQGLLSSRLGTIWIPHWFLALIFAIIPAIRLRSILRARRLNRPGLCQHCGYDLRATPDRCPECGTVSPSRIS